MLFSCSFIIINVNKRKQVYTVPVSTKWGTDQCGDGGNRTPVHMSLLDRSTQCSLIFDLSECALDETKHTRTDLLI
jgi:hypothetical protein